MQNVSQKPSAPPALSLRGGLDNPLEINTSRFGRLTVDADRLMTFPRGLLGFPQYTRFALIQAGEDQYFFWLQCASDPKLAFVVTDPVNFFPDYQVPMKEETAQELELADPAFGQVFVICNKVDDWLTANLLGPIVVNAQNKFAQQIVLTEKRWSTRQPVLQVKAQPLARSA